jgi:SAM-dependent methyltransferase
MMIPTVGISSEQERDFFDAQYAQFLDVPDHALRTGRKVIEGNLANPQHPFFERQRLYSAAMRALEASPVAGAKVLDYGCGTADFGLWLATEGADVTLLDLSPAAIELGRKRARASGVEIRGVAADAARLPMFGDEEFDLVFACAALHHTMKYPGALEELARVMKPGARLVLCETWGGNPLLNLARRVRASVAGEHEEQGEGIIMSQRVLKDLDPYFENVRAERFNLSAMGKRLLRGRFGSAWARLVLRLLEGIDRVVLAIVPPLRDWCGEAVITAEKKRP